METTMSQTTRPSTSPARPSRTYTRRDLRTRMAELWRPDADPKVYRNLLIGLGALMAVFSIFPLGNSLLGWWNKDYDLWFIVGWYYRHGGVLYPTDGRPFPYMYPPAAAMLLSVLSVVGRGAFVGMLVALQSASWIGSILLSVWLATGRTLRQAPGLYLVPTLFVVPCIHDMYLLGQPNLLLLFLLLGAFASLRVGRPWLSGSLVALAAAIKAFPVLALGYFVWRREWKAVGATLLWLVLLLLVLPLPFRGRTQTWQDMTVWTKGMVLKYDEGQIAQRPDRCYSFKNQALVAVTNRLLRDLPADGESRDGWQVNFASLNFKTVNLITAAIGLSLCLFYVIAMPPKRLRDPRVLAAETAMLTLLILAFSPFAFNYFYVWILYPVTVLLARVLEAPAGSRERQVLRIGLITALSVFASSIVSVKITQAYGNLLATDLILLGLLGWVLIRRDDSEQATAEM